MARYHSATYIPDAARSMLSPGIYFVTISIERRACLLGEVLIEMHLSNAGVVIDSVADDSTVISTELDAMVVMPNHLHGVLHISTDQRWHCPNLPRSCIGSRTARPMTTSSGFGLRVGRASPASCGKTTTMTVSCETTASYNGFEPTSRQIPRIGTTTKKTRTHLRRPAPKGAVHYGRGSATPWFSKR